MLSRHRGSGTRIPKVEAIGMSLAVKAAQYAGLAQDMRELSSDHCIYYIVLVIRTQDVLSDLNMQ